MAMSDCDECWDTPCTCGHGYERPRMSLARLREVVAAATRVLADREATGDPEPVLHPKQQMTAEQWGASIEIPLSGLGPPPWTPETVQAAFMKAWPGSIPVSSAADDTKYAQIRAAAGELGAAAASQAPWAPRPENWRNHPAQRSPLTQETFLATMKANWTKQNADNAARRNRQAKAKKRS